MKKINEPNNAYHSSPAINRSRLSRISISPQWFKYCEENPPKKSTDLIFGSAFHKLVLEPETFDNEYLIADVNRRTNAGKQFIFDTESQGKDVISTEEWATLCAMRDSVLSNPYAVKLLDGERETSFYWTDQITGLECKCRPDVVKVKNDCLFITDLKSCRSTTDHKGAESLTFMHDAIKYGYDLETGMYAEGTGLYYNIPIEKIFFVFLAVEKEPPYMLNILTADTFFKEQGRQKFREYLGILAECKATGNYYGYLGFSGKPNDLSLPPYLLKKLNEEANS